RVVISGMGAITSLGSEIPAIWQALLAGRSGVRQIRQFDSDPFPVKIGSEVDLDQIVIDDKHQLAPLLSRTAQFGIWALDRAWQDAGLEDAAIDLWRAGVCIGASNFPVMRGDLARSEHLLDGDRYNADNYLELCRAMPEILAQREIGIVSTLL